MVPPSDRVVQVVFICDSESLLFIGIFSELMRSSFRNVRRDIYSVG